MSAFRVSKARRGLDLLLRSMPMYELVEAEWQEGGPWLLVTLGQLSDDGNDAFARHPFAIWKHTGAVHGIEANGAVTDDPVMEPA